MEAKDGGGEHSIMSSTGPLSKRQGAQRSGSSKPNENAREKTRGRRHSAADLRSVARGIAFIIFGRCRATIRLAER